MSSSMNVHNVVKITKYERHYEASAAMPAYSVMNITMTDKNDNVVELVIYCDAPLTIEDREEL